MSHDLTTDDNDEFAADTVLRFSQSLAVWMTAIFVGLFIIRPWEKMFPELSQFRFMRIYIVVWILCVVVTRGFRFDLNRQSVAAVLVGVTFGIATLLAVDPSSAGAMYYNIAVLILSYFIIISAIKWPQELLFVVVAFIAAVELYCAKALAEYFYFGGGFRMAGIKRIAGVEDTYGNPNDFAITILASMPLWLFLWSQRTEISRYWSDGTRAIFGFRASCFSDFFISLPGVNI